MCDCVQVTIVAMAPVRIADLGGWTDTWFARSGCVLNVAVEPGVTAEARAIEGDADTVYVGVESYGYDYSYRGEPPGRHPLIEAAVAAARPSRRQGLEIRLRSAMPPGAGTGTSAAVIVAIIGALDALAGRSRRPLDLAQTAHGVEVSGLGRESGLQDHLAAAYGGVSFIEIPSYPQVRVERVALAPSTTRALAEQLVLVYLGRAHQSSDVHRAVIAELDGSPGAWVLQRLRDAARAGKEALVAGDLAAFGRALVANTQAQRDLHPRLVSEDADAIFRAAERGGALGWKVNGAGGDGGSVTVLVAAGGRSRFEAAAAAARPRARVIPITLDSRGLRVRHRRSDEFR
jgi:D-glycero-alpha-D-manno-heptose-7-phosphate kinase